MADEKLNDPVNHPSHYLKAAITIEPIELTARLDSCLGQALQYLFRAPYKGHMREDMEKALFYLIKEREIMQRDRTDIDTDITTQALARVFYMYSTGLAHAVIGELFMRSGGGRITETEVREAQQVVVNCLLNMRPEEEVNDGVEAQG